MIQKYFSIAVIFIGILVVSCRQDNDLNSQQENKLLQKEDIEGGIMNRPDTLYFPNNPVEPPRNGTHYRVQDLDSLGLDEEIAEPPRNGTHYRSK